MDTYPISSNSLEKFYHIDGDHFGQQYKEHLSDYRDWDQLEHAEDWIVFSENMGTHLSIDETALSNGDLYTIVTNKAAKGKKGALVAMVKGTKSDKVVEALDNIPENRRKIVQELTLDMAKSMRSIGINSFPCAERVVDRFHVQKLVNDALQEIRISYRWEAINEETEAMEQAKFKKEPYIPKYYSNGDSKKQLLARCRYLLFKSADKWSLSQKQRAKILFSEYPDIKKAYGLAHSFRLIFAKTKDKDIARTKLALWYNKVAEAEFKSFNTISATVYEHYPQILNYFNNRSTNASAESFNAKLKSFRASLRGVTDISYFLYRVAKIHA